MPNGGVPMHMVLFPKDGSQYVLYLRGGTLMLYSRQEWEASKAQGKPLLTLSAPEGASLAWFLRYWLGEEALRPGYDMPREISAIFDY